MAESAAAPTAIPRVTFPDGRSVPALGQGTWSMGERPSDRKAEVVALQAGIDLGLTLIDTAEMYGEGGAEEVVSEAISGRRDSVFVVSKVYPWNASRKGTVDACERSLKRMGIERIDLYLLHWRGEHPLSETVEAFERLKETGKIGAWGVSNFDVADMEELLQVPAGENVATNQILYNLARRGPEYDLLPWCDARNIPVMAYSPIEQGRIIADRRLLGMAEELGLSAAQLALAFVLRDGNRIAIPKTSNPDRIRENRMSVAVDLSEKDWAHLDALFPPPGRKTPLEML